MDNDLSDDNAAWLPPVGWHVSHAPTFDPSELAFIHSGLKTIIHPTWLTLPPLDINQKQHGKLTAAQWHTHFKVCLPKLLLKLWFRRPGPRPQLLIWNLEQIVAATRSVSSFTTSPTAVDNYTADYIAYQQSCRELWPTSGSVPNHHYAMHNGPQLKFWGPLILLSKFPFESNIRILQNIRTNNHYGMCFCFN